MNKSSIKVGLKVIKRHGSRFSTAILSLALLVGMSACQSVQSSKTYSQTTELPEGLHTPDVVETSIGTLKFIDGAPLPKTAELVYENLDRMRGVDVFLKCMSAASVRQLMVGPEALGANQNNKVLTQVSHPKISV